MSHADLIYASCCQSGYWASQENSKQFYLTNTSLDNGAGAFFGWQGSPLHSKATLFDKYFWSAIANGIHFDQCLVYASGKVSGIGATPIIHGDGSNELEKVDSSYIQYIGSASNEEDEYLDWHDENAFHVDYDYFRFVSVGTHSIEIYVTPTNPEFDVAFKVYSSTWQVIATVNTYGVNHHEYYSFVGSGTYHLKVYITSGVGGTYDLDVDLLVS